MPHTLGTPSFSPPQNARVCRGCYTPLKGGVYTPAAHPPCGVAFRLAFFHGTRHTLTAHPPGAERFAENLTRAHSVMDNLIHNFKMLVDTKEQTPLPFPPEIAAERRHLFPGDYSIDGLQHAWAVERKSLSDLVGSLFGHKVLADGTKWMNRDRLYFELSSMRRLGLKFAAVVVTSPLRKLMRGQYRSKVSPETVRGLIWSMEAKTGVPFEFYESEEDAARSVVGRAWHFWREFHGLSSYRPQPPPISSPLHAMIARANAPQPLPPVRRCDNV